MARKYRIKQKGDKHYPQYKVLFWWEYFVEHFSPRRGAHVRLDRVYYYDFNKARDVIQRDKRERFTKTTEIK